ncbi:proline-rich acidic protein 1 [Melanerpes formicivorus]|uniref:proline-rich acidic protein 1 n=1 Tax=Melanerpes formicivorus TaxID=211600 RepID=UPI00358F556A
MECSGALRLCGVAVLLGAALLLPPPGGAQALDASRQKDTAAEQEMVKEIILGLRAVEPPQEAENHLGVEPGTKVLSSNAWAQVGLEEDLHHPQDNARGADAQRPLQRLAVKVQSGPEEDLDHLYHPQDDARGAAAQRPLQRLAVKVQSGPEEDLDHLYHPQDDAREADAQRPPQRLAVKVQSGPEEDLDHLYHS